MRGILALEGHNAALLPWLRAATIELHYDATYLYLVRTCGEMWSRMHYVPTRGNQGLKLNIGITKIYSRFICLCAAKDVSGQSILFFL